MVISSGSVRHSFSLTSCKNQFCLKDFWEGNQGQSDHKRAPVYLTWPLPPKTSGRFPALQGKDRMNTHWEGVEKKKKKLIVLLHVTSRTAYHIYASRAFLNIGITRTLDNNR